MLSESEILSIPLTNLDSWDVTIQAGSGVWTSRGQQSDFRLVVLGECLAGLDWVPGDVSAERSAAVVHGPSARGVSQLRLGVASKCEF